MSAEDTGVAEPAVVRDRVVQVWNDILAPPAGQERATFFELGGQSINAVQMVTRIEEDLGIWIDVGELFEDPDLDTFTGLVVSKHDTTTRS
jgi:acyl carrier protein